MRSRTLRFADLLMVIVINTDMASGSEELDMITMYATTHLPFGERDS